MGSVPTKLVVIADAISVAVFATDQKRNSSILPVKIVPVVEEPTILPPINRSAEFWPVPVLVIVAASCTPLINIFTTPFWRVTATCVQVFKGILVCESNPAIQLLPSPKLACNLFALVIAKAEITSLVKISE